MRIEIPELEAVNLAKLAYLRNRPKFEAGYDEWSQIDKRQDPLRIHRVGLGGEWAAREALRRVGVSSSLDRRIRNRRGDDGVDLVLEDGLTVSVKVRQKWGQSFALYATDPSEFVADYAVLVWVPETFSPEADMPIEYEVVGIASKDVFLTNARVVDYGFGERLALDPCWFVPLEMIFGG